MTTLVKKFSTCLFAGPWHIIADRKSCRNNVVCMPIGLKLQVGVAIATIACIGFLFFSNNRANTAVESKVNNLLGIHKDMADHLRDTVFDLQNKYLSLPDFFVIDPTKNIISYLEENFPKIKEEMLKGRETYVSLYNRKERRDLAHGRIVYNMGEKSIFVSLGVFDDTNEFTDAVRRIRVEIDDPQQALHSLQQAIEKISQDANNSDALKVKVGNLSSILADEVLKTEDIRNEILYRVEQITENQQLLDEIRAKRFKATFIISCLTLGFNLLVLSILTRNIIEKPLRRLTSVIDEVRTGKMVDVPYANRRDQIGILSATLSNFKEAVGKLKHEEDLKAKGQEMLAISSQEMSTISAQLATTSEELSTQSERVAGATGQMSASINSMASSTEEMNTNIQSVSSTTEQMSQNMSSIAISIEQMATSIEGVSNSAKSGSEIAYNAKEVSDSATSTMGTLANAAREIGEVTDLIKRIAEQTNLLALNATIEAASAGDAGRGFAVVAREIKELAIQSREAAGQIAQKIKKVQENSTSAIISISEISDIIHLINESSAEISKTVEEQTKSSSEISESVLQAKLGIASIADSMAELSRGSNDVARNATDAVRVVTEISANIHGVSNAARETNSSAQQVKETAEKLADIASQHYESTLNNNC